MKNRIDRIGRWFLLVGFVLGVPGTALLNGDYGAALVWFLFCLVGFSPIWAPFLLDK